MIKLSKAGKMPCPSFSTPALRACPGAIDPETKTLKPVCKSCYATKGTYQYPSVKKLREDNLKATENPDFVSTMVSLINNGGNRYFRWFDSGDIHSELMLAKVTEVCKETPEVKHWIPTKSRELFSSELWAKLESLPNVRVRYSSPSIDGSFESLKHGSVAYKSLERIKTTSNFIAGLKPSNFLFLCPVGLTKASKLAKERKSCEDCRACWSKDITIVAYRLH
jgi:hypothetical protein